MSSLRSSRATLRRWTRRSRLVYVVTSDLACFDAAPAVGRECVFPMVVVDGPACVGGGSAGRPANSPHHAPHDRASWLPLDSDPDSRRAETHGGRLLPALIWPASGHSPHAACPARRQYPFEAQERRAKGVGRGSGAAVRGRRSAFGGRAGDGGCDLRSSAARYRFA